MPSIKTIINPAEFLRQANGDIPKIDNELFNELLIINCRDMISSYISRNTGMHK
jgi:hypothetical protein